MSKFPFLFLTINPYGKVKADQSFTGSTVIGLATSPYKQTNITDSYLLILLSGLPEVIGLATSPYEQTNIADNV